MHASSTLCWRGCTSMKEVIFSLRNGAEGFKHACAEMRRENLWLLWKEVKEKIGACKERKECIATRQEIQQTHAVGVKEPLMQSFQPYGLLIIAINETQPTMPARKSSLLISTAVFCCWSFKIPPHIVALLHFSSLVFSLLFVKVDVEFGREFVGAFWVI